MIDIEVVKADMSHVDYMARNMNNEDRMEVYASYMVKPETALRVSIGNSTKAWTVLLDGKPEFAFGVSWFKRMSGVGAPWMLGTGEVKKIYVPFLRQGRDYVDMMIDEYDSLENYVSTWNKTSIKWLKFLGFDILDSEPYGPFGYKFHKFTMEKAPCVWQQQPQPQQQAAV